MKKISKLIIVLLITICACNISNVKAADNNIKFSYHLYDDASTNVTEEKENTATNNGTLEGNVCTTPAITKPLKLIGRIISIAKIILPIILIVFGVIDFFKAVVSSKPEELGKSIKSLVMRAIAAVIVFFLPTIIHLIFLLVDDWAGLEADYKNCSACLLDPKTCVTD